MDTEPPRDLDTMIARTRALRRRAKADGVSDQAMALGLALEAIDALVTTFGLEPTRTFLLCQEAALRDKTQVAGLYGTA